VQYPPRLQRHLQILSAIWMSAGALYITCILIGMTIFKFFFFGRLGQMRIFNNHADLIPGIHVIVPIFFSIIAVFGIAAIIIGYGLHQRANWARMAAMVFGSLALLKFPFGTALGIYTLWVLAPATSVLEYDVISQG
jgi:hypothetical protein